MSGRRPTPWAERAVRVATQWLPVGEVRMRYRRELRAELWGLRAWDQARLVLGLLLHAPALTHAVRAPLARPGGTPLHFRLHLWHRWHVMSTEDGARFRRCLSCGEDDDGTHGPQRDWRTGFSLANRGVY